VTEDATTPPKPPVETPPLEESPFPIPPLDWQKRGDEPPGRRAVTEPKATTVGDVDPGESPFDTPAIEGLPFGPDSDEARAISRILGEARPEPARHE
jgi:hypothetical protein